MTVPADWDKDGREPTGTVVVVFWNLGNIFINLSKLSCFLLFLITGIIFQIKCLAQLHVHPTSERQGTFSFCQEPHEGQKSHGGIFMELL